MVRYIHAGYPKCFSTLLQRYFFEAHPNILHLGVGCGSNVGYRTDEIAVAVEHDLTYSRFRAWRRRKEAVRQTLDRFVSQAGDGESALCVGISKETLTVCFPPGSIEPEEKAQRLFHLFGPQTRVILIVRRQDDLHRSFYSECVRMGFPGSFSDYVDVVYRYQDRNFCRDFHFHLTYDLYAQIFGPENVGVFCFEDYRNPEGALIADPQHGTRLTADLSRFLGLPPRVMPFEMTNPSLPSRVMSAMASLNTFRRHGLGRPLLEGCEDHRLREYWPTLGLQLSEEDLYADVRTKRALVAEASGRPGPAPDYGCNQVLWERLLADCLASNRELYKRLPHKAMPQGYLFLQGSSPSPQHIAREKPNNLMPASISGVQTDERKPS